MDMSNSNGEECAGGKLLTQGQEPKEGRQERVLQSSPRPHPSDLRSPTRRHLPKVPPTPQSTTLDTAFDIQNPNYSRTLMSYDCVLRGGWAAAHRQRGKVAM
jgi:hypothetical protein